MSASLVGSEMCIRDRTLPALGAARWGSEPGGRVRDVLRAAGNVRQLTSPCLLYTSDAADDM
eukprot:15274718-Alexandrium_andersonii.AAC.1